MRIKAYPHGYAIWYVPCPADADYEINFYAPQVEGAFPVELIEFKNGRRIKQATATKE